MDMGKSLVSLVKVLSSYKALNFTNRIPGDNSESKELMNTMPRQRDSAKESARIQLDS